MSLGQFLGEFALQGAMQFGEEAIKERYGCRGCVIATLIIAALIGVSIWLLTR